MSSCVAVCTLKDTLPVQNVALVGTCLTENLGIENIVKAIIKNPGIRFLIVAGTEPEKRFTGQALKCLAEHGVDDRGRIRGAKGLMPFLKNLTQSEVDYFRKQVRIIDLVGVTDLADIEKKAAALEKENPGTFVGHTYQSKEVPVIEADYDPDAGWTADPKADENWFVIKVDRPQHRIVAEHYAGYGDQTRQCCTIVGKTPESILGTIVKAGKVKGLYHAAYLGKELQKAAIALKKGVTYNQELEFDI